MKSSTRSFRSIAFTLSPRGATRTVLLAAALSLGAQACAHSASWSPFSTQPPAASSPASAANTDVAGSPDRADEFEPTPSFIAADGTDEGLESEQRDERVEPGERDERDAPDERDERDERDAAGSPARATPPAAVPTQVSVQLRSACGETVAVLYAEGATDTTTRIDPSEVESHTFRVGAQVWVLDRSEHKLASATITASVREVQIGSDCTSVSAR